MIQYQTAISSGSVLLESLEELSTSNLALIIK